MSAPASPIVAMLLWNGIKIMVNHVPNFHQEIDHIEVRAENDQRLPITETGYRSHYPHESQIEHYGSALAYVQAWLDHEAATPEWRAYEVTSRQLSLF